MIDADAFATEVRQARADLAADVADVDVYVDRLRPDGGESWAAAAARVFPGKSGAAFAALDATRTAQHAAAEAVAVAVHTLADKAADLTAVAKLHLAARDAGAAGYIPREGTPVPTDAPGAQDMTPAVLVPTTQETVRAVYETTTAAAGDVEQDVIWFDDPDTCDTPRHVEWSPWTSGGRALVASDEDGREAQFTVTDGELSELAAALGHTLLRDRFQSEPFDAGDRRAALVAGLALTARDALILADDEDNEGYGRYLDWSGRGPNGEYHLEVGRADGDTAVLTLSPEEMERLHAKLMATLLAEQGGTR